MCVGSNDINCWVSGLHTLLYILSFASGDRCRSLGLERAEQIYVINGMVFSVGGDGESVICYRTKLELSGSADAQDNATVACEGECCFCC